MMRLKTQLLRLSDPSDTGNDNKGYAMRHGSIVKHIYEKNTGEIDVGCDWATNLAREHKADWFVWDGDGMGAGLKRQVANNLDATNTKYQMFKGSLSGKGQDHADNIYQKGYGDKNNNLTNAEVFKNNRADWLVDESLPVMIPDDDEMQADLCASPFSYDSKDRRVLWRKDRIKEKYGFSPDYGDAAALTFSEPVRQDKRKKKLNYGPSSLV